MTTTKKQENTSSDTQAILAPLGKYAVIAVIMVTTIVTTAIVLDKQMNNAEKEIEKIEASLAYLQSTNSSNIETNSTKTSNKEANEITLTVQATTNDATKKAKDITAEASELNTNLVTSSNNNDLPVKVTPPSKITSATPVIASSLTQNKINATKNKSRQEYANTFKLDQKRRMTEMFARISKLESQQLDRYETNQNQQIIRLQEQISQKNNIIKSLILRNKDLYQLRKANVQRNQSNREQILNRI